MCYTLAAWRIYQWVFAGGKNSDQSTISSSQETLGWCVRKEQCQRVKAPHHAKYFQGASSSFTDSSTVISMWRYPPAKQKICSKPKLASEVGLDCWCDKWYLHHFNSLFIYETGEIWWIFIPVISTRLFAHEVCCQKPWFCFVAHSWDNKQNCVFPKLAFGAWSWALWREPQLAMRCGIASSG